MATAGSIVVDLLARTGSFETSMDRAAKRTRDTAKALDRMVLAAGAAGVAFIGAATAMAMQSAKTLDSMAKMAQATGLSVEALSALTYVAGQNGLEQQTLVNALGRLSKGMDDAARGTGDAKRAFDALGVTIRSADGTLRSADDVLVDFAEEISKMEDGTQKTALAMQVFGRSGAQLVPLLNNGRKGIKDLADEAKRFGVVMDTEVAKNAERFNDNLTRLATISEGLALQFTAALLPALETVTNKLVDVASETDVVSDRIDTALTIAGTAATAAAAIFAGRLTAAAYAAAAGLISSAAAAAKAQIEIAKLGGAGTAAAAGLGATAFAARTASLALALVGGPVGALTIALGAGVTAWSLWGREASAAQKSVDELTSSLEILNKEQLAFRRQQAEEKLEHLEERAAEAAREVRSLERDYDELVKMFQAGRGVDEQGLSNVNKTLVESRARLADASQEADKVRDAINKLDAAARSAAGGFGQLNDKLADTRAEWLAKYATQTEKLNAELDKAREAFGGMIPPDIEERIRKAFAPRGGSAVAKQISEGERLIAQMNERIALIGKETEYEQLLARVSVGAITFKSEAQKTEALARAQTLDSLNRQVEAFEETQKSAEEFARIMVDLFPDRDKADQFIAQMGMLNHALEEGWINAEMFAEAAAKLEEKFSETTDSMSEFAVQAARNIQDSLGDGLYDLVTGKFDDIGSRFSDMLLRMATDAAAANLAGMLFGDYGTTGKIGGIAGDILSGLGGLFGGGRATGGPVSAGKMYEVNEDGMPELLTIGGRSMLMMAGQSGRVTPLSGARAAPVPARGRQPSVVINSVVNAAPGTNAAELSALLEQRDAELRYQIYEDLRRGRVEV